MPYEDLIKRLRSENTLPYSALKDMWDAANAIEELLKAAKAMHTWIFLNSYDEQVAYDECDLTDEMNAELGYSGQFIVEPPKEET